MNLFRGVDSRDRADAQRHLKTLIEYRNAADRGRIPPGLKARARKAFLFLGGDPFRSSLSLRDYDHQRHGPFLGVSDEGSAGRAIRRAAMSSPKARALSPSLQGSPLAIGVALDAERLAGVGEVAVGPDEYADIWLECAGRLLITTNVGTRVNLRAYASEPIIVVRGDERRSIDRATQALKEQFQPFVNTPDGKPRPLTVFVDIPRYVKMSDARKQALLTTLNTFVTSGEAAGRRRAPKGHRLGLATWISAGLRGQADSSAAIALAKASGIKTVLLDGIRRKDAAHLGGNAGLLDYFAPGIVGPLLRDAQASGVLVRAATVPDTDTIARSTWVGLLAARNSGAHLGKYGCFPLTLDEIDRVVEQVQGWMPDWSAAPVFFVDQGLLRSGHVDAGNDLPRGIKVWLRTVASHRVRVVLIDTIDKSSGKGLLKRTSKDKKGFLRPAHITQIETLARRLRVKVLWAGGLNLRDTFEMGKLGVFGIYVTTAAATATPVRGTYISDPRLAALKEPSFDGVLRTKVLLEAGFLASNLEGSRRDQIDALSLQLLDSHDRRERRVVARQLKELVAACEAGWRQHWKR